MKRSATSSERGVAMILVLWIALVLSLLVAGFAFSMHVETELASYQRKQFAATTIARSGVEIVKMLLIADAASAEEGNFDALNQRWATNELFYADHPLGEGTLQVRVVDEESKFPINRASTEQVRRLLDLLDIDPMDAAVIADSIEDWLDENDLHQLNGAEDQYYQSLEPPYRAKNGPCDRVEELLLVRGVTAGVMYGGPAEDGEEAIPGLVELLSTTTSGRLNVNTASALVLQAYLGLDDLQVEAVFSLRHGADGVAGTEDDQPFRSLAEFFAVLGKLDDAVKRQLDESLTVQSSFFSVHARGTVGNVDRAVTTILRRDGGQVIPVLWQESRAR